MATGQYAANRVLDLTGEAKYVSSDPKIARVEGSTVLPVADGTATIIAIVGDRQATATVIVKGMENPAYVSFKNETLPALTKAGCNMGACHGSPSGKAGFRLSLRGFDPPLDVLTLRTEYFNRRTNIMDPAESLILKKPLMEVAHGGGRRLHKGDASYRVLFDWISEGLRLDPADAPDLVKIEVLPSQRVFHALGTRQQLRDQRLLQRRHRPRPDGAHRLQLVQRIGGDGFGQRPRRKDRTRRDGHPRPRSRQDVDRLHDLPRRRQRLRLDQSARQQLRRHARASTSSSNCRSFLRTSAATKSSSAAPTSTRRAACPIPTNRSPS